MSHFYGTVHGARGMVSRCGHRQITAHTRGWNFGILVSGERDGKGNDVFSVHLTEGSHGPGSTKRIGTWSCPEDRSGPVVRIN